MLSGGPLGHAPPLRSPNFTLDIGLSQKKVHERRSIGRKTRVAPPLARFLDTPLRAMNMRESASLHDDYDIGDD